MTVELNIIPYIKSNKGLAPNFPHFRCWGIQVQNTSFSFFQGRFWHPTSRYSSAVTREVFCLLSSPPPTSLVTYFVTGKQQFRLHAPFLPRTEAICYQGTLFPLLCLSDLQGASQEQLFIEYKHSERSSGCMLSLYICRAVLIYRY